MQPQSLVDIGLTPYRGLRPFLAADAEYFFGRRSEVKQMVAGAFSSPLTVVYGPSGVGKSSVLNAGLMDALKQRRDLMGVLYSDWSDGNAMESIAAQVRECARQHDLVVPINDDPVGQLRDVAAALEKVELLTGRLRRPIVITLDQFEDYTKYRKRSPHFERQFIELVNTHARSISIVVSIREDNVTLLDQFRGEVPGLFDKYMRIGYLDRSQAKEAILGPLGTFVDAHSTEDADLDIDSLIDQDLIDLVLDDVSVGAGSALAAARPRAQRDAGRIETAYLQLVMATLWERRSGSPMTPALYDRLGKAEEIVRNHVGGVMGLLSERERQLASLTVPHLVTASGLKLAQHADDMAERIKRPSRDVVALLCKLEETGRILRVLDPPDAKDVHRRYEPYHDRIAEALLIWKDAQDARDPSQRYRRRLRNQVAAAVTDANANTQSRAERGVQRLGALATQTFDQDIRERAFHELEQIAKRTKRQKLRDRAKDLLKKQDGALREQIAGDLRAAVASLARIIDRIECTRTDEGRLKDEHADLSSDIAEISDLTEDLLSQAESMDEDDFPIGPVDENETAWDHYHTAESQLSEIVPRMRSVGLGPEADALVAGTKGWFVEEQVDPSGLGYESVDFAFATDDRWLGKVAAIVPSAIGATVFGEVISWWWLERFGRPSFEEIGWVFLFFVAAVVAGGFWLASETWPGELLRNAVVWSVTVLAGWLIITHLSLMIHTTYGVGIFWPLWILAIGLGLLGFGIATMITEY